MVCGYCSVVGEWDPVLAREHDRLWLRLFSSVVEESAPLRSHLDWKVEPLARMARMSGRVMSSRAWHKVGMLVWAGGMSIWSEKVGKAIRDF